MPNIKTGPFGIEKKDMGVWNRPDVTIYGKNGQIKTDNWGRNIGDYDRFSGFMPKHHGGCSGILEMENGTWHLLGEDDDHYWSEVILRVKDLRPLLFIWEYFADNVKCDIDFLACTSKFSYPSGIKASTKTIRKRKFSGRMAGQSQFELTLRDGRALSHHVSHLAERIIFLKAAIEYTGQ